MTGPAGSPTLGGRRLGLLLSTAPDHPNLGTCLTLARAALEGGVKVYLYLIDDGVVVVDDARVQDLQRQGLNLFVCAYGAQRRRLPITERATYCGLVVLSDVMRNCDRFVAFN